jgi:DNA polymerase bacteriophage-type
MATPRIHIDFEARSLVNLLKLGADVYARHFSTSPTMLAIVAPHINVAYVQDFLLGVAGYQDSIYPYAKPDALNYRMIKPPPPPAVLQGIAEDWIFVAHNARFEQTIWYHICHKLWGWPMPRRWSCTAARARYWGLRASLDGAASDLEVLHQKDANGKQFINDFCKPRKYKGAMKNGIVLELWYEPQQNMEGWKSGLHYCLSDAYAEMDIDAILPDLPEFEQRIWDLDFALNNRGLPVDVQSVARAVEFSAHFTETNFKRFDEITNLRPTQRDKVLEYINQREDIENIGDLKSKTLKRIVMEDLPLDLRDVITIRLETSKASIKKLDTMLKCTDTDGFARGLFLYGGAHTLRWSAKRIQPQNFTRPDPDKPQDYMFAFLEADCWNAAPLGHNGAPPLDEMPVQPAWVFDAGMRFIRPLGYLAQSMRGFIKAPDGKKIVAGDYAQIEARVLAWLARCMWLLDAFRRNDDVYSRFAADHMYRDNYDDYFEYINGVRSVRKPYKRKRQVAKSAVLGCGYGLGKRNFVEYCDNTDLVITEEESETTIKAYREAHPEIAHYDVGLWSRVQRAALVAVSNEHQKVFLANTGVSFHVHRLDAERYWLVCTLPSGRHIAYYRPKVRIGTKWGRTVEILSFRKEWNGKSYREDTYGGKLVENIVQGAARDICALGALNAENAGYFVHGLVHDEVITLVDRDFGSHEDLCKHMCNLPVWITDLPVEADGATMVRYGK